jgi:hypothetical protein
MLYTDAGNAINNWAVCGFRILLSIELFRVHGLKKFRGDGGKPENVPNPLHLPQAEQYDGHNYQILLCLYLLFLGWQQGWPLSQR